MKLLAHIGTIVVAVAVFFMVPLLTHINVQELFASEHTDAVSSASVALDAPSGHYTILINKDVHSDPATLNKWEQFFAGEYTDLILEDVNCTTLEGDTAGRDMALSLQSRLAENQMTLRTENATLALSKAQVGTFDVLVMSNEIAQAFGASSLYDLPYVEVVHR